MRMVTGAILLLAAEQAFAHTQLVRFPNHQLTQDVLFPASAVLAGLGLAILIWGVLTDVQQTRSLASDTAASSERTADAES